MNKKNLILTPTRDMSRHEWLAFRQPINHVRNFIVQWYAKHLDVPPPKQEELFLRSEVTVTILKKCFESQEWKDFVFPCIGASEISPLLGLNPYYSVIELFFEKVSIKPYYDEDNVAMFWGRELEEQIAQKWQYWDGSPEGMIANFAAGDRKRKCRRTNFYTQNKEFPWIFCSLDRIINKQGTDEEVVDEGALECKTISGFYAKMWENEIPPMHVVQHQTQLGVLEFQYGELAILKDGRYFDVMPFDRHQGIIDRLIKESKNFFDNVKYAIERWLLHQATTDENYQQQLYSEIEFVAPEPDGSDSYKNYLSETYQNSISGKEVVGTAVEEELARQYKWYDKRMKDFDYLKTESRNKLCAFMKDIPVLTLGELGKVTWREEGQKGRVFRVNVKVDPSFIPEAFKAQPQATIESKVLAHSEEERQKEKKGTANADESLKKTAEGKPKKATKKK
jgi:putative phage-type endonuclease